MVVKFNHLLPAMPELGMGLPNTYRKCHSLPTPFRFRPLRPQVSQSPTVGASPGDPRSAERRGRETTAVNIFEKQRNLLWVNDLIQLIMYCNLHIILINIVFYIANANLIVKLGDMDKD
jgi:hypothetical protein